MEADLLFKVADVFFLKTGQTQGAGSSVILMKGTNFPLMESRVGFNAEISAVPFHLHAVSCKAVLCFYPTYGP